MFPWLGLFKLALANLRINKLRSGLTILGMVFGTGAVIATLSSNEGAAQYIKKQLEQIGTNIVYVSADNRNKNMLSLEDKALLLKYSELFDSASYVLTSGGSQSRYETKVKSVTLFGVETPYFEATRLSLKQGRVFSLQEDYEEAMVVILGANTKKELFGDSNAISEYVHLYVDKADFMMRVIGVLKEKGGPAGQSLDGGFFIPQNTLKKLSNVDDLNAILAITLLDDESSPQAKLQIEGLLASRFPKGLQISDAREAIERTKGIWEKQNLVGICLAIISLLTGGVGIMNIMLLSVTQRRKEIGLRKAVGASNAIVLSQFLLEAVSVCFLGGILGIIAGLAFGQQVAKMMGQWEAVVSPMTIVMALAVATLTGVVFGLAPAYNASKLDPYEALRA